MITRTQYMNKEATHRQYYGQFVTPEIKKTVCCYFGKDKLTRCLSKDNNLNNISLHFWDLLAQNCHSQSQKLKEAGDWLSPAGCVCILKEAAKQVVEENN